MTLTLTYILTCELVRNFYPFYVTTKQKVCKMFQVIMRTHTHMHRVVLQAPWSVSATDLRRQLHWLPVRQQIHIKLATITYKTMMSDHPSYLHDQLCHHQSIRSLRSSTAPLLQLPPVKTVFAARAFSAAAPKLWNSLSARTRSANTSATFRSRLKTELFFGCLLLGRFSWTQRIRFACDNCALQIGFMLCYVMFAHVYQMHDILSLSLFIEYR